MFIKIFQIIIKNRDVLKMATELEFAKMSSAVYKDLIPNNTFDENEPNYIEGFNELRDWKVVEIKNDNANTGFFGAAFQNTITGEIVIACRGTEPSFTQPQDLIQDIRLISDLIVEVNDHFLVLNQFFGDVVALHGSILTNHQKSHQSYS